MFHLNTVFVSRGIESLSGCLIKLLRSVRRKRKVFRKYKDINHPAVKSACRVARVELRKSRRNFEEKLALNIKNDSKILFCILS